jgi:hypothetical protein
MPVRVGFRHTNGLVANTCLHWDGLLSVVLIDVMLCRHHQENLIIIMLNHELHTSHLSLAAFE